MKEDIYITSSPNSESLCHSLFKEKFVLPVKCTDYYMYSSKILVEYFEKYGVNLICQNYFYEETPYCDIRNDIEKVERAIKLIKAGKEIDFISPPYYDNMLTLVLKKGE